MNRKIRLRVHQTRLKPPTAKEHDAAYRRIGCVDGIKPLRDRERVPRQKKRRG